MTTDTEVLQFSRYHRHIAPPRTVETDQPLLTITYQKAMQIAYRCCVQLQVSPTDITLFALLPGCGSSNNVNTISTWIEHQSERHTYEDETEVISRLVRALNRETLNGEF